MFFVCHAFQNIFVNIVTALLIEFRECPFNHVHQLRMLHHICHFKQWTITMWYTRMKVWRNWEKFIYKPLHFHLFSVLLQLVKYTCICANKTGMPGQTFPYSDIYLHPKIKMIKSLIQELLFSIRFVRHNELMPGQAHLERESQTLPFLVAWLGSS